MAKQSIGVFPTIGTNITCARNSLVIEAIKAQATHLFWADSDSEFPQTAIERFLRHDKDIVFANYSTRRAPFRAVSKLADPESWRKGGLQLALTAAHGTALIRASVYEKVRFPWYVERYDERDICESNPLGFTDQDEFFSERAAYEGYDLWCDIEMSQETGHIGEMVYRMEGADAKG